MANPPRPLAPHVQKAIQMKPAGTRTAAAHVQAAISRAGPAPPVPVRQAKRPAAIQRAEQPQHHTVPAFNTEDPALERLIYRHEREGMLAEALAAFYGQSMAEVDARINRFGTHISVAIETFHGTDGRLRYRHVAWHGMVERYRGAWGPPHSPGRPDGKTGDHWEDDGFGYGSFTSGKN